LSIGICDAHTRPSRKPCSASANPDPASPCERRVADCGLPLTPITFTGFGAPRAAVADPENEVQS
jgi:hypothetical protein